MPQILGFRSAYQLGEVQGGPRCVGTPNDRLNPPPQGALGPEPHHAEVRAASAVEKLIQGPDVCNSILHEFLFVAPPQQRGFAPVPRLWSHPSRAMLL